MKEVKKEINKACGKNVKLENIRREIEVDIKEETLLRDEISSFAKKSGGGWNMSLKEMKEQAAGAIHAMDEKS